MRFFRDRYPSPIFWPLSLAGTMLAVGFTKIYNFDIWWHLKTGSVISQTLKIPTVDIFSYTASGNSWINHEWLFQILAWNLYDSFGIAALTIFQFTIAAGIAYTTFRTIKLLVGVDSAALWGTTVSLVAIADRVMARPFLISLLFTALFAMQLNRLALGKRRHLFELPIITILWINLHGGGILSPQMVMAFAVGESIQLFLRNRMGADVPNPIDRGRIGHLWLIALLCAAACLVSPHGTASITFPLKHLNMPAILSFTQEWLPSLDPRLDPIISQIMFRTILVLTPISYIAGRKSVRLSHLMLTILSSILILNGKRFTPDFVIINIPIIFFNFKELAKRVPLTQGAQNYRAWGHIITVAVLSAIILKHGVPATIFGGRAGDLGFGTSPRFAPSEMVDFLEDNDIHGRGLNEMGGGGYLIFRRWPGERVFIDGRTPVYGNDFFEKYTDAMRHPRYFEELDQKYEFDYLVFKGDQIWDQRQLHVYFWNDPKWKLVYAKKDGFVYLRDIERFKKLIDRFELKQNPLIEEMKKNG